MEALRKYTIGSAYFAFDANRLDSIEKGQLAGLVVLNDDPLTVLNDRVRTLSSMLTLHGGRIVAGTVR